VWLPEGVCELVGVTTQRDYKAGPLHLTGDE